jgi:AcrR family transcriptional regulator
MATTRTKKAEETRTRILDAALKLFRERGYEKATMRAIAEEAGVSVGNAYYYFASKERMIQAFYARTHAEHMALAGPALERQRTLKGRLSALMETKLETIEPYHRFAGILFKTAADPKSPLNPFSEESRPVRAEATALFARALAGSKTKVHAELAAELPNLLWLYHMGIIAAWIHDESPGRERTRRMTQESLDLIVKLISLSSLPLMGAIRRATLRIVREYAGAPGAPPIDTGTV